MYTYLHLFDNSTAGDMIPGNFLLVGLQWLCFQWAYREKRVLSLRSIPTTLAPVSQHRAQRDCKTNITLTSESKPHDRRRRIRYSQLKTLLFFCNQHTHTCTACKVCMQMMCACEHEEICSVRSSKLRARSLGNESARTRPPRKKAERTNT